MKPCWYEIVVEGDLSAGIAELLAPLRIEILAAQTLIVGEILDQAQLLGVLLLLLEAGLTLIRAAPARNPERATTGGGEPPDVAALDTSKSPCHVGSSDCGALLSFVPDE